MVAMMITMVLAVFDHYDDVDTDAGNFVVTVVLVSVHFVVLLIVATSHSIASS